MCLIQIIDSFRRMYRDLVMCVGFQLGEFFKRLFLARIIVVSCCKTGLKTIDRALQESHRT